jgi:hypothetical protein
MGIQNSMGILPSSLSWSLWIADVLSDCTPIRNQSTILVFYLIISWLAAPLKFIYSSIQVTDILVLIVSFKLIYFVFQFSLFFPEISSGFTSYIVQIVPIYFIWIL